jgi:hypothetical protein
MAARASFTSVAATESGKPRSIGWLCFNCNQALGNVRDDIRVLYRLVAYLMKSTPDAKTSSVVDMQLLERMAEVDRTAWKHRAA